MKKIFTSLFIIALSFNFANADNIKQSKDVNKTMSDDEFMKEFMRLDKNIEIKKKKIDELEKTNKKIDEIIDLLNKNKLK